MSEGLERGLLIPKPVGNSYPYDFIVDCKGRLSRVNVKSTTDSGVRPSRFGNRCIYSVQTASARSRSTFRPTPYTSDELDFIVAHLFATGDWYVLPISSFEGKRGIHVIPGSETSKYEQFKGAWDLLCQN